MKTIETITIMEDKECFVTETLRRYFNTDWSEICKREERIIIHYPDKTSYYMQSGNFHNDTGPAIINNNQSSEYYLEGDHLTEKEWKEKETWISNITLIQRYYPEIKPEEVVCLSFFNGLKMCLTGEGKLHNTLGPAVCYSSTLSPEYYLENVLYSEEEWKEEIYKRNLEKILK